MDDDKASFGKDCNSQVEQYDEDRPVLITNQRTGYCNISRISSYCRRYVTYKILNVYFFDEIKVTTNFRF